MPRAKKTWKDKMVTKPPHHVVLEKDFAGVKSGSKLHISSLQEIADELRKIRPGETVSLQQFRQKIAQAQACDASCPVSTSIFLRIVAEYAWEEHNERHVPLADLPPFWRVVEPGTPLSKNSVLTLIGSGCSVSWKKTCRGHKSREHETPSLRPHHLQDVCQLSS
jgi:hypothetical protein